MRRLRALLLRSGVLAFSASGAISPAWAQEPESAENQGDDPVGPSFGLESSEEDELEFEAVAEVEAPPREPTKHSIEEEQLTRIPGTRGDALRAIEVLPGVSRTQFATNFGPPLLRGSSSEESLVVLDGAQVPVLYHFGGLTSFFNSYLLEEVSLYPGNYQSRYGRAAGGVVEAKVRDPKTDGFHAMLELSMIDSFALAESPLGEKTALALAARRSNIDLFFDAAISDDDLTVVSAPVYWDYQAILTHRFNEAHKLKVMGYGSYDRMELYVPDSAVTDPGLHGDFGNRDSFHRLQVRLSSKFSEVVHQELMVSLGPSPGHGQFGELEYEYLSFDVNARADWSVFAAPWLRIDTGLDFLALSTNFDFVGAVPGPSEGSPSSGAQAGENYETVDSAYLAPVRPAAYVEASIRPTENLLLIPGVRVDYFSDTGSWQVDPRIAARWKLLSTSTLKGGVGLYSQPPNFWEASEDFGNPELRPFRTFQASFGGEQELGEYISLDLEGFYKDWQNRVVGTEGGEPPGFENGGTGYAYGLEALFDLHLSDRSRALASYTLSRSMRQDGPNEAERFFDYDQTHNFSLTANYDLGKGWLVGARFRYVTGRPYSAPQAAAYDASSDTYRPLYSGVNDERNPAFHQLDIRGEKLWHIGPVDLTAYLEVFNVYNAKNQEQERYSYDYSVSEPVTGMPFFPNLGVRGQF